MNLVTSSSFAPRADIYPFTNGWGWTPLHWACKDNRDDIAIFLIKEERERVSTTGEGQRQDNPSYNMRDYNGCSPVFKTSSERIVEEMIKMDDLQVTDKDGMPLLWHCAKYGCVSEGVASDPKLVEQYGQRWWGRLPLEEGKHQLYLIHPACK